MGVSGANWLAFVPVYYMKTWSCKFDSSFKYRHPRQAGGSATPTLNYKDGGDGEDESYISL
ncbi:Zinc finger CCCH domain-containing protein [Arachis hypogaea]|nr:Zinc finger CCCH domain-containing protein [Arachis hypogaea]